MEILLTPRDWSILAQLKPVVDAIDRRQGGGQYETNAESRPAALLQEHRQNVWRIGEKVRAKIFLGRIRRKLCQILDQLRFRVAPGEISVGLGEAGFRQCSHHLGPGERLRQENRLRAARLYFADQPLPKRQ